MKQEEYQEYQKKYQQFIYKSYTIEEQEENYKISFHFSIPQLEEFHPYYIISKKFLPKLDAMTNQLLFHIGLVELISYWKVVCPKHILIEADYISEEQMEWFKKLYYYGLGEFFYTNQIEVTYEDFVDIKCSVEKKVVESVAYQGRGNLIPIGGGKDSIVTLELLKEEDNSCFILNPKNVTLSCAKLAGLEEKTITVNRFLDKKLVALNEEGYLNGHTPFSALLAFVTFLIAYQNNKRYIILSNEGSANEATVIGSKINHQYSKTYEFENDFNEYTKKYLHIDITYFSFLRPLSELQIALLFSKMPKYHAVFKSCNVGSKEENWHWCCSCGKCLFVFCILSPFLYYEKLIAIFKEDLFQKQELLPIFRQLIGSEKAKPFDCVGTIEEVRFALSCTIRNLEKENQKLPFLLEFYQQHYELSSSDILKRYGTPHNLNPHFDNILKKELQKYV